MAYTPRDWTNVPLNETPPDGAPALDAANLSRIEDGISAAHDEIDGRLSEASLSGTFATKGELSEVATGDPITVTDVSMAAAVMDESSATRAALDTLTPTGAVTSAEVTRIVAVLEGDPIPPLAEGDMLVVYAAPTSFYTDFSHYPSGPPADWSKEWDTTEIKWDVVADVTSTGGKVLRCTGPFQDGRRAFVWDAVPTTWDSAELLMRWRTSIATRAARPALAVSGDVGAESAVLAGAASESTTTISSYADGTYALHGTTTVPTIEVDTWYWTRTRMADGEVFVKHWADGTPEPGAWTDTHASAAFVGGGGIGMAVTWFIGGSKIDLDIDVFAVGLNGTAAGA